MWIDGKTRICGLMGNPVEHTLSPMIHNTTAELLGHNLVYVPFLVKNTQVEAALRGAIALDVLGMNVTVPYKSEVLKFLEFVDPVAAKIGAVNTLVRTSAGFKGYNTDITGLYRAMQSDGIRLEEEHIIILGAGGVARAVAVLCASHRAKSIHLLNRTLGKAEEIAGEINIREGRKCIIPMELGHYDRLPPQTYCVIQCTSAGLYPKVEEAVIKDAAFYQKVHIGYDLIYKPAKTTFMKLVEKGGGQAYNGLKMLLYQGLNAYELWNEVQIEEEMAHEIYKRLKRELKIDE